MLPSIVQDIEMLSQDNIMTGPLGVPGVPNWVPLVGLTAPLLFADFTTEGSTNHYYYNGLAYGGIAAWLSKFSGTFSRASPGTYLDTYGILRTVGNNTPRFEPKGLLFEGAGTNLLLQSNNLADGVTWFGFAATFTQSLTGPDGVANSGWQVTEAATFTSHAISNNSVSLTTGTAYTVSFFLAKASIRQVFLEEANITTAYAVFDPGSGTVVTTGFTNGNPGGPTATITPAGNWYLCTMTFTPGSSGAGQINLFGYNAGQTSYAGDGVSWWGVYGFQVEASPFATSYMATTTATVTRQPDELGSTPISWYNTNTSVIYTQSDTLTAGAARSVSINDGTQNNCIDLVSSVGAAQPLALVDSGGSTVWQPANTDTGQSPYSSGVAAKAAISAAAGNFIYVKNAGTPDTNASGAMPVAPTQLNLGNLLNGSNLFGHLRQFGYWSITATSAQLQTLTT